MQRSIPPRADLADGVSHEVSQLVLFDPTAIGKPSCR